MNRTIPPLEVRTVERFWAKVQMGDECWVWTGATNGKGYGSFGFDHSTYLAHRISYTIKVGPIQDGMTLDHLCRNKVCVRPDHLEQVSISENNTRRHHWRYRLPISGPKFSEIFDMYYNNSTSP